MAYVKVPKDLSKVKTKVALNLTKRQLIGFLSTDISMILMSIVVLPILFATLYEKDNLPFEKHLAYIVRFHKAEKIRVYKSRSIYNTDKEKDEIKGRTPIPISKMRLSSNGRRRIE